jgi:hypothetical protein
MQGKKQSYSLGSRNGRPYYLAPCGRKEKIHTSTWNKTVVMMRFITLLYTTEFDDRHLMVIY